jgi:hypothetical protein
MKYVFENNINFFDELYKSLDIEENLDNNDNICLITKENLCDRFVKMDCGHKFNYLPLFNDISNHKKKFNNMESRSGTLHSNEIRCPYCRNKQTGVLPYYEDLSLLKINGVNHYDPNIDYTPNYAKCEFLTPKLVFDNDEVEESTNSDDNIKSKSKFTKCYLYGSKIIGENYGDNKKYCYYHKKIIIKSKKKEILDKKKEDNKIMKEEAKQKIKEEKQVLKEVKKVLKEEKQKEKQLIKEFNNVTKKIKEKKEHEEKQKETESENVVVGNIIIDLTGNNYEYCSQILKTGSNKGTQCSKKVFNGNLCKRHYQLLNEK